ncbi:hypothetical protein D4R99_01060 [bacterium]|nr:MAG: hypothetical protein D4R99_01060 [bacterium]
MVDIGSSSVGAAAVLLSSGYKPKVFYSVREEMIFQKNFSFERFASSMLKTLGKVLTDISVVKLPDHSGKTFSCFLSSPWYASQTIILEKKTDVPVMVDEKFLYELQKKEIEDFKVREIEKIGRDAVILETKTIQTKLNGYETGDPFGKKAQEIEVAIYASISSEKIVKAITERVKKVFHMSSPQFYSFSLASFTAIRDMFHEKNFLFMDISGEASDLSVVRNHILEETIAFPIGKNSVIRKIAEETALDFQESASLFRMVKDEDLEKTAGRKIKKAMLAAGKEWILSFQNALSSASTEESFPKDIFVTADNDVSKWFIENLQDAGTDSFSVVGNAFTIRHLNGTFLSAFCDSETGSERDPFLMIESLFLDRAV